MPPGLQVVLYHHLSDEDDPLTRALRVSTPPALFEAHLTRLIRDYDVVDLDQILSGRLPKRALLITFDDGYRSVLERAGPILSRLGLPSVFFISAAFVTPGTLPLDNLMCWIAHTAGVEALEEAVTGSQATGQTVERVIGRVADLAYGRRAALGEELADRFGVDCSRLRTESGLFLDHSELPSLADFACEVGNHTRSHLFCRAVVDDATADHELVQHKRLLEEWAGVPVRAFSYPYGNRADATPFVEHALAASGHEATFVVESRPNRRHRIGKAWNRISLDDQPLSSLGLQLEVLPRLRAVKDSLGQR